jgi:uncharacterized membrane protein
VAELIGLVLSIVFVVVLFLPLLTFLRLSRISRELEQLASRLAKLETASGRTTPAAAESAESAPVAVAPLEAPAPSSPVTAQPAEPVEMRVETKLADLDHLEERIGGRGLLYAGVLVLLLGVSFFLKYAFDNEWIDETGRSVLGALGGIALIAGGLRLASRGLGTFGHALVGTGLAILYLVVYAALNFYALIDRTTAFVSMALITLAAAVLADRQRSQPLAFIAVGGGLLTPALVGGDENAQLTLFTYDAVLVLGTLVLSLRHQWLALNALSYTGTLLTIFAWTGRFYTEDQWLRTLLFLTLFCVSFMTILRATRQSTGMAAMAVRALLYTAPVLYHIAAVVMTAGHPPAIHIYLIAFTVVGLWWTVEPYRPVLRLLILLAAFVPMFGDLTLPSGSSWLVPNVVTITAVAALHVMALLDRVLRQEQHLRGADLIAMHVTGIGLFSLLYETLQPAFPAFRGGLAALVALGAAALARWVRSRDENAAINGLGLTFALAAIGIAVQFDGAAAIVGWAAEGAVIAWIGVTTNRYAFQFGGLLLWAFASVRLFETFSVTPAVFTPLLNARALATVFVSACGYVVAWQLGQRLRAETARARFAVHIIASVLTLGWITGEIQSFWDVRADSPIAYLYEQTLLSLAWGVYGAALIGAGMVRSYPPLRYIGIAIIGATSFKVFFYDLWQLGGIYRVVGFIAFGVLLVLVSYLYQKRRATDRDQSPPPPPPSPPPPSQPPPPPSVEQSIDTSL